MTSAAAAPDDILVTEVFSAIQGEGLHVGRRQVFLRLTGCNIRCSYCDQPEALDKRPGPCRIERTPGRRDFAVEQSPLAMDRVVDVVDSLWRALPHHAVSVTGGEPLLQGRRLAVLLPRLRERGHRVALETNGMLTDELRRVVADVDIVSMDVKLSSVDGQSVPLRTHREFLTLAAQREVYVKIVVGPDTDGTELFDAVAMVAAVAPATPVFLQPVTPFAAVEGAPSPDQVLAWQETALAVHPDVRVVPQTHKQIGQL